jgi:hypothetical protein
MVPLDIPTDTLALSSTSGADIITFGFGALVSGGGCPNVMQEVVVDYIFNLASVTQPFRSSSSQITPNIKHDVRWTIWKKLLPGQLWQFYA